jgi:hypothetical protein
VVNRPAFAEKKIMKAAIAFIVLLVVLGYVAMIPAGVMPRPYGLWVSVPLLFASVFIAFAVTMRFAEGRLSSFSDLAIATRDGKDMFLSWALYAACMIVATGIVAAVFSVL